MIVCRWIGSARSVWALCGALITILVPVVSASRGAAGQLAQERHQAIEQIVRLLEQMADWPAVGLRKTAAYEERARRDAKEIEETMKKIAAYDSDAIRKAVLLFQQKHSRFPGGEHRRKLFLLNQYLFNLPERLRRDSPHFAHCVSNWTGMPMIEIEGDPRPSDEAFVRWPWAEDEHGVWRLVGRVSTYYGPSYDAIRHFDYLRKVFGRRSIGEAAQPKIDVPSIPDLREVIRSSDEPGATHSLATPAEEPK